ncbi:MAG TPA: GIDE domain-containing protein [Gammaproteobacteria bacterium]
MNESPLAQITSWIRRAPADEFWLVIAIIIAASLAGFWIWFRSMKRARLIEDTPTSKCRSAAQGYVELIGTQKLMPGDPIRAPLTGKQCTWWEYCVEEKRTSWSRGRRRTRWVTVDRECSESLFLVCDDTGEAVIDPEGAEVTPSAKERWYGASRWPKASATGVSVSRNIFGGRYRYTENRMHEDDALYAIGFFETRSAHHEPMQRARETAALLATWKRDQAGLLQRFDANASGDIDMAEWEKARRAAEDEVSQRVRELALDPGVHLMSRPPDSRPYILSVLPQTELTKRFRMFAVGGLLLFFACGAAAVFSIGVRLAGQ